MIVEDYFRRAGLARELLPEALLVDRWRREMAFSARGAGRSRAVPDLFEFPVPVESDDGEACDVPRRLAPEAFDLRGVWPGDVEALHTALVILNGMLQRTVEMTGTDWLGVYRCGEYANLGKSLLKLVYSGGPSRAYFPLNSEFERKSTNAAVAMSGRAVVIPDIREHVRAGGAYYPCDPDVRSEACLPLFSRLGAVIGVLDAESRSPLFFRPAILAPLLALAIEAPGHLPDPGR